MNLIGIQREHDYLSRGQDRKCLQQEQDRAIDMPKDACDEPMRI